MITESSVIVGESILFNFQMNQIMESAWIHSNSDEVKEGHTLAYHLSSGYYHRS